MPQMVERLENMEKLVRDITKVTICSRKQALSDHLDGSLAGGYETFIQRVAR